MTQARSAAAACVAAPASPAWQAAKFMEFSNDFNVGGTSTAASVDALSAIASNGDAIVM